VPLQRVRVIFAKGEPVKYISHLDLMRVWERALRRARVPLAYSQGFNPRPRLFFAAALPVGFIGRAEMLDVFLEERMELSDFGSCVAAQMPAGVGIHSVDEVPLTLPALPSRVIAAEYEVLWQGNEPIGAVQERLEALLAADSVPRRRERPDGAREYDLRPLIERLWLIGKRKDRYVLGMRLRADAGGTGRPDEVMAALGMAEGVRSLERVCLLLEG